MEKIEQLIDDYLNLENNWDAIMDKFYPSPEKIFKWHEIIVFYYTMMKYAFNI